MNDSDSIQWELIFIPVTIPVQIRLPVPIPTDAGIVWEYVDATAQLQIQMPVPVPGGSAPEAGVETVGFSPIGYDVGMYGAAGA